MADNDYLFGEDKKGRDAIYFIPEGQDWRINPIYSLDDAPNTPDRFVIVKTTANGRFLIKNKLYYKFKGVDIITDSDNAIFVDTINSTVVVREYSRALREINPEDPENRQYVLLLIDPYDEDYPIWQAVMGRTATYNFIKDNVNTFDPKRSLVLTENVALKDAFSISQFVIHLHNADIVHDDFDIRNYELEEED